MTYRWLRMGVVRSLAVLGLALMMGVSLAAAPSENTASVALWLQDGPAQGKPLPVAMAAVHMLQQAGDDGLNPRDYDAAGLAKAVSQANEVQGGLSAQAKTTLAKALDEAMRRYLHDLHYGRVDPASVYANFNVPPKTLDVAATLHSALLAGDLEPAVKAARPQFPLYQALRPWLARYRTLESDPAWSGALPPALRDCARWILR